MSTNATTSISDPTIPVPLGSFKELVSFLGTISETLERTSDALENIQYALEHGGLEREVSYEQ